jgi:hypothetical protein
MNTVQNIQMQMLSETINKVESIRQMVDLNTKSDAVKVAVDLSALVVETIQNGGEVIMIDKNGEQTKIRLVFND